MVLLLIFPCGAQGLYKVLPHGGKEIQHHTALQTDTAVHDAVLLEQGVAGAYLPGLVPAGTVRVTPSTVKSNAPDTT